MRVDVLTLFPEMFTGPLDSSIISKARQSGRLRINVVNIRDFAKSKHKVTDDEPYGGGPGMVMMAEPVVSAVEHVIREGAKEGLMSPRIVMMTPQGDVLTQDMLRDFAIAEHLVIVCGHYEGIDERVKEILKPEEVSIGDYVLTGGEIPAMVLIDGVARLVPGVLGKIESTQEDSFSGGLLEGPHYTRPREFRGMSVPEVLLSGNHRLIRRWRRKEALKRTWERRPDLFAVAPLTPEDLELLEEIKREQESDSHERD
ncbi:MAG TPA: tRNA (guanosine(37)-N1)-methyltransferase TrmD [Clostridia bacterium]|nr:tRNA (guanosine(37)-N1)-methyltransferase TrmD [Clostridia bacterium]